MGKVNFYKDRVACNFLAKDINNALEVTKAMEGHCVIGVLTKNYDSVEACAKVVKEFVDELGCASVGLGAGDPKQWKMVADVAAITKPGHVNEVFTGAMYCRGVLDAVNDHESIINCLMSPTGEVGKIKISTGPVSSLGSGTIVTVEEAIAMMKDVGLNSIKYFNIHGLQHKDELAYVTKVAVENGIEIMEPTGGLDPSNVKEIIKICLDAGCKKVIPHVYSSIVDKQTGLTNIDQVKDIYRQIKELL